MKTMITSKLRTALLAAVVTVGLPALSHAQLLVVYEDHFNGTGNLNGQTVETSSGTNGGTLNATWNVTNGSPQEAAGQLNISSSNQRALLPLSIQSGNVYTLSADVNPGTGGGNSATLRIGFTGSGGTFYDWASVGQTTAGSTFNPDADNSFAMTGVSGPSTVIITLDTTQALWTASVAVQQDDETIFSQSFTYETNPTGITGVGFRGTGNGTDKVLQDFKLTVGTAAVPEPSSYVLGLLIVGALAFEVRRRALAAQA